MNSNARTSLLTLLEGAGGATTAQRLGNLTPAADFVLQVPIAYAREHLVMGFVSEDDRLLLAVGESADAQDILTLSRMLNRSIQVVIVPDDIVTGAINQAYQQRTGQAQDMIEKLDRTQVLEEVRRMGSRDDLLDNSGRAPVIKLVNLILFEAARANASDVHIQPYEDRLLVRTRVDGVLYDAFTLPRHVQEEIVSRVKVMGKMNIAEKRLAQDGRATVQVGDRIVDLRIASLPTSFGERVVIRLLEKNARLLDLAEIGMDAQMLARFSDLVRVEHGLILVTGPTGSGKSTTLYAALKQINSREKNLLTLEDPIEYQIDGISQTQVSDKKGMTFASGLRSVLRQDPDVIMVGEIRDRDTASMSIQSSLTGHLVYSTLHTNDAASAVTRLLDLGVEPYLVGSSVVAVLAQRLLRKICDRCAIPVDSDSAEIAYLNLPADASGKMRRGRGCAACRQTGYRGRVGAFELLVMDETIRKLIQERATAATIRQAAIAAGMRTLREDGISKVIAGVTTVEEVERVTSRAESIAESPVENSPDQPGVRSAGVGMDEF